MDTTDLSCYREIGMSNTMVQSELAGMLLAGYEALGQCLTSAMQLLADSPSTQVCVYLGCAVHARVAWLTLLLV